MKKEAKELAKSNQEVQKQEHSEERSIPGKFYAPQTDILESDKALLVKMDMPGVKKGQVKIMLENNVLEVEGAIDPKPYSEFKPLYTEYNIGHYTRKFTFSNEIDSDQIAAKMDDGVLTLTLPKKPEAAPRQIAIS